jgi:hypothetical protein
MAYTLAYRLMEVLDRNFAKSQAQEEQEALAVLGIPRLAAG